jgi:hypothetical protein
VYPVGHGTTGSIATGPTQSAVISTAAAVMAAFTGASLRTGAQALDIGLDGGGFMLDYTGGTTATPSPGETTSNSGGSSSSRYLYPRSESEFQHRTECDLLTNP